MRHALVLASLLALLPLAACGDGAAGIDLSRDDAAPRPPRDSGKGDDGDAPGVRIEGLRRFALVGDALTPGHDALALTVVAPAGAQTVDVWIGQARTSLPREGEVFRGAVDISSLPPGTHRLLFAADGAEEPFAARELLRSHALYVFVSTDWDDPDNEDATLERQDRLHARHPSLRLTHFVGPYTFTDPALPAARVAHLVDWVKAQRDGFGDEVGLHIHPYCSFVEAAGVACRTAPSFARASDDTGYTVILAAYEKPELDAMLRHADQLFYEHGLDMPTSFRAGGWTADAKVLRALADDAFVADASAANWTRMEEWRGAYGASLYGWVQEHWTAIDDETQPYYPSSEDVQAAGDPFLPILELPDNGLLVDYVRADEMIEVFEKNRGDGALEAPRLVSIGYHPPNFSEAYFQRMDEALAEIDRHLAETGDGPVVYATASELVKVWPKPSE